MATIVTSTATNGFPRPGSSFMMAASGGELICVVKKTSGALGLFRSLDGGSTWTDLAVDLVRANLEDWSGIEIDESDHVHIVYRVWESVKDRVYYRRWHRAGDDYVLDNERLLRESSAAAAGDTYTGMALTTLRIGDDRWRVPVAVGVNDGGDRGVIFSGVDISKNKENAWVIESSTAMFYGDRVYAHAGSPAYIQPSLDRRRTPTPDLMLSYGRATVWAAKIPWSASSKRWNAGTSDVTVGVNTTQVGISAARFGYQGDRYLIPVLTDTQITVYDYNMSLTSRSTRLSPVHPTGVVRRFAMTADKATGNFRLYAIGTSTGVLYYVDWTRASNTWGTWTTTGVTPLNIDSFGVRDKYGIHTDPARYDVFYGLSTGGNNYTHLGQTVSYSPTAPTWVSSNGVAAAVGSALVLDWDFHDADPTDSQTKYALSRQIGAGTIAYWRASDSTWQATEQQNTSTTTGVTIPSSWGADGDAAHNFAVKTWDTASLPSSYSAVLSIVPSTRQDPTIATPVNASTITTRALTTTWTMTDQAQYRVMVWETYKPGADSVVHDSGWIVGTDTTYTTPAVLEDDAISGALGYYVQVYGKNSEGLEGLPDTNTFTVDFVAPPVATLVVAANAPDGTIDVDITNPAPTGLEPDFLMAELFRREVGDTSDGTLVVSGLTEDASYSDYQVASGVEYEYRVKTWAEGSAISYSAWTD